VLVEILVQPEFEVVIDARSLRISLVETAQAICAREVREGVRAILPLTVWISGAKLACLERVAYSEPFTQPKAKARADNPA
jgi:hypothetical protein